MTSAIARPKNQSRPKKPAADHGCGPLHLLDAGKPMRGEKLPKAPCSLRLSQSLRSSPIAENPP
jgi:hypothetical protein